jgi:hypothetical protein
MLTSLRLFGAVCKRYRKGCSNFYFDMMALEEVKDVIMSSKST